MSEETRTYSPDDRFYEAIATFEEARDAGLNPTSTDWLIRYPDVAEALRAYFADARNLCDLANPIVPFTPPPDIPDYDSIEPIESGIGGMGIVFKARRISTQQIVALKVIRTDLLENLTPEQRRKIVERFITEARVAALLEHENIVKVYDVGEAAGRPYYAMRYVEGKSLSGLIQDGSVPPERGAAYIEQVARAVHVAHQHGIIHRDLKPNNILIDSASDKPLVADFGLAKLMDRDQEMTRTGDIMGAPPYMSPEQALNSASVTTATDVYGLGATLYALLTGRPPFQGDTPLATLKKVLEDEPTPPRRINPAVPRDLATICLKCLKKEPGKRYASAAELADDLQNFREGLPINARPTGPLERIWRWCRRNARVAILLVCVALSLLGGTAFSTYFGIEANRLAAVSKDNEGKASDSAKKAIDATADANDKLKRLLVAEDVLKENVRQEKVSGYATQLSSAQQLIKAGDIESADEVLAQCPIEFRDFEHLYLIAECRRRMRILHKGFVFATAFSPDGKALAIGTKGVKLIEPTSGRLIRTLAHSYAVLSLAYTRDGRLATLCPEVDGLFSSGVIRNKGKISVWDAVRGDELLTIPMTYDRSGLDFPLLTISPDGEWLATSSSNWLRFKGGPSKCVVWNAKTGQQAYQIDGIGNAHFHPKEGHLAIGAMDGTISIRAISTGIEISRFKAHSMPAIVASFDQDGTKLATVGCRRNARGFDTEVKVFEFPAGKEVLYVGNSGIQLALSPDGKQLTFGRFLGFDLGIADFEIINTLSGRAELSPPLRRDAVTTAFSPDGEWVAVGGFNFVQDDEPVEKQGNLAIWKTKPQKRVNIKCEPDSNLVFSADSRMVAGTTNDEAFLWDAATGEVIQRLEKPSNGVFQDLGFNARTNRLIILSRHFIEKAPQWRVWENPSGKVLLQWPVHQSPYGAGLWSMPFLNRDATRVYKGNSAYDLISGRTAPDSLGLLTKLKLDSNDKKLSSFSPWQFDQIADRSTRPARNRGRNHLDNYFALLVGQKKRLVTIMPVNSEAHCVKVWDMETGAHISSCSIPAIGNYSEVAIHPSGRRAATLYEDGAVILWDLATGRNLLTLRAPQRLRYQVSGAIVFSPDGLRLAVGWNGIEIFSVSATEPISGDSPK